MNALIRREVLILRIKAQLTFPPHCYCVATPSKTEVSNLSNLFLAGTDIQNYRSIFCSGALKAINGKVCNHPAQNPQNSGHFSNAIWRSEPMELEKVKGVLVNRRIVRCEWIFGG